LSGTGTGDKMEVQWGSRSATYRLKESLVSVRREVLYNVLIELGITMKLCWLIKICLSGTYIKVHIGEYLSDVFLFRIV
jgi:hypothetical protein